MSPDAPLLAAVRITKRFPGVVALRDVSFELRAGDVHALCGENGAGKSTLIKLLSGVHPHGTYEGELMIGGAPVEFHSIRDAERAGLAVIYQELALVEQMTVAENICLGAEPTRFGFIDSPAVQARARALLNQFAVRIDPGAQCARLGVGQKQLVEIVKALGKKSRILILDEPTAALAEHEVQTLLTIVRDLRQRGLGCIYISHKLDEVFAVADRITVLRDGASIVTLEAAQTTKQQIVRHMVGREITDLFPRRSASQHFRETISLDEGAGADHRVIAEKARAAIPSAPALRVKGLSVAEPRTGKLRLRDISLSVAPGEVLGIGGLMGAGRTELLMHLFGAWGERRGGAVELMGDILPPTTPDKVLRRRLAFVTEDRRRYGLVFEKTIGFNLSLCSLRTMTRCGVISGHAEFRRNDATFRALAVRAPNTDTIVDKLSGGNQQKVVLGRALMPEPAVIFLDEPTRGIDVGAKAEIYQIVNQLTADGKAVVLVSSELPELLGMSDRIIMLHEGALAGEFTRAEASPEKLIAAAMGHHDEPSVAPVSPSAA